MLNFKKKCKSKSILKLLFYKSLAIYKVWLLRIIMSKTKSQAYIILNKNKFHKSLSRKGLVIKIVLKSCFSFQVTKPRLFKRIYFIRATIRTSGFITGATFATGYPGATDPWRGPSERGTTDRGSRASVMASGPTPSSPTLTCPHFQVRTTLFWQKFQKARSFFSFEIIFIIYETT